MLRLLRDTGEDVDERGKGKNKEEAEKNLLPFFVCLEEEKDE